MHWIGSPEQGFILLLFLARKSYLLTNEIVGGNNNAGKKQDGGSDSVMSAEDHVVNVGLIDQVADFDEARHCWGHPKNRHFGLALETKQKTVFY